MIYEFLEFLGDFEGVLEIILNANAGMEATLITICKKNSKVNKKI